MPFDPTPGPPPAVDDPFRGGALPRPGGGPTDRGPGQPDVLSEARGRETLRGAVLRSGEAPSSLRGADIGRAVLEGDFRGVDFSFASCDHTSFARADLTGAVFRGWSDDVERKRQFHGAVFPSRLDRVRFEDVDFANAYFGGADLSTCVAVGCDFTRALLGPDTRLPRDCRGSDLSKLDLSGRDLRGVDLRGAVLAGADLRGSLLPGDLSGAVLTGALLTPGALAGKTVAGADLRAVGVRYDDLGADLRGTRLGGLDLAGRDLRGHSLAGADLTGAVLSGTLLPTDLRGVVLAAADLAGRDLSGHLLDGADFNGSDLTGCRPPASLTRAVFTGAVLAGVDFSSTDLTGADLSYAAVFPARLPRSLRDVTLFVSPRTPPLEEIDLRGARLTGTAAAALPFDLSGTRLRGRLAEGRDLSLHDLTGADLNFVDLSSTRLPARLSGASFVNAVLYRRDLSAADLTGVDFTGAYLAGVRLPPVVADACFEGADLTGVDLSKTCFVRCLFRGARTDSGLPPGAGDPYTTIYSVAPLPEDPAAVSRALFALVGRSGVTYSLVRPRASTPRHAHMIHLVRAGDDLVAGVMIDDESAIDGLSLKFYFTARPGEISYHRERSRLVRYGGADADLTALLVTDVDEVVRGGHRTDRGPRAGRGPSIKIADGGEVSVLHTAGAYPDPWRLGVAAALRGLGYPDDAVRR